MDRQDEEVKRFVDMRRTDDAKGRIEYNGHIEDDDVYETCGKRLGSGKAVGGHSRSHFAQPKQPGPRPQQLAFVNQDQGQKKIKIKILMNGRCAGGDEVKSTKHECACCHKSFDSQKALHGHMRSHPERDYRGLVPPSPSIHRINGYSSNSSNSTLSQDDVLNDMDDDGDNDLIKVSDDDDEVSDTPLRWHCTGKRGRTTRFSSSENEYQEVDAAMLDAASTLMSLKYGYNCYDGNNNNVDDDVRKTEKVRQNKKPRYFDEAGPSNHGGQHRCSICNKSFTSHQALGGHMSSHRKPVVLKVKTEADGEARAQTGFHQCELCGKVFETGQALGGHKRCHRTIIQTDDSSLVESTQQQREPNQTDDSSLVESTQQQPPPNQTDDSSLVESIQQQQQQAVAAAQETARVVFDFDLNEPAFGDDEDL